MRPWKWTVNSDQLKFISNFQNILNFDNDLSSPVQPCDEYHARWWSRKQVPHTCQGNDRNGLMLAFFPHISYYFITRLAHASYFIQSGDVIINFGCFLVFVYAKCSLKRELDDITTTGFEFVSFSLKWLTPRRNINELRIEYAMIREESTARKPFESD